MSLFKIEWEISKHIDLSNLLHVKYLFRDDCMKTLCVAYMCVRGNSICQEKKQSLAIIKETVVGTIEVIEVNVG